MPGPDSGKRRGRDSRSAASGQAADGSDIKTKSETDPPATTKSSSKQSRSRSSRSSRSSTKDKERDIDQLCDGFRMHILITSGGWLGSLIPWISNATGIWDIFLLVFVWVIGWVAVRESPAPSSMILALVFDVTIPLQHQLNPKAKKEHERHLERYWPIQGFAAAIEVLCFFLVHPYMFTMVVGIKTTLMTGVWLYRKEDGTFLVEPAKPMKATSSETTEERDARKAKEAETAEQRDARKAKESETPEQRDARNATEGETPEQRTARKKNEAEALTNGGSAARTKATGSANPAGNGAGGANAAVDDDSDNAHLYDTLGDRLDNGIIPHREGDYYFPRKDGKIHPAYATPGRAPNVQDNPTGQPVNPSDASGQQAPPPYGTPVPDPNSTSPAPPTPPAPKRTGGQSPPPLPPPGNTHGPLHGDPNTTHPTVGRFRPFAPPLPPQPVYKPNLMSRLVPGLAPTPKVNPNKQYTPARSLLPTQKVYIPPKGSVPIFPNQPHGFEPTGDDQWRSVMGPQGLSAVTNMLMKKGTSAEQIGWVVYDVLFQRDYRTVFQIHESMVKAWYGTEGDWQNFLRRFRYTQAVHGDWKCRNIHWWKHLNEVDDKLKEAGFTTEERKPIYLRWMNMDAKRDGGGEDAWDEAAEDVTCKMSDAFEIAEAMCDDTATVKSKEITKNKLLNGYGVGKYTNKSKNAWYPSEEDVAGIDRYFAEANAERNAKLGRKHDAVGTTDDDKSWIAMCDHWKQEYKSSKSKEAADKVKASLGGMRTEVNKVKVRPILCDEFGVHVNTKRAEDTREVDRAKKAGEKCTVKPKTRAEVKAITVSFNDAKKAEDVEKLAKEHGFPLWRVGEESLEAYERHIEGREDTFGKLNLTQIRREVFALRRARSAEDAYTIAEKYGFVPESWTVAPIFMEVA